MNRRLLPVAFALAAAPVLAQNCATIPGRSDSCVRVLACLGETGHYFDGIARGWDQGSVTGALDDGSNCTGQWSADGPLGFGTAQLTCDGGLAAQVLYTQQDNDTGTVIGTGKDSLGRVVTVWSGLNVLGYLMNDGSVSASLPCGRVEIPVS